MEANPVGLDIVICKGIGQVLFGMFAREVEALLGRADDVDFHEYSDERTITLSYSGMAFFFDQSDNFRLSYIEVDSRCYCHLFGEPLFPRRRS
jgi:hypothetical protein